jgi:hypothetical protein
LPRNGSGTYARAVSPYVNGTIAEAPTVNTEMNDIASALTQSLSKDGQTTPTANLPMGGNKHTSVGDAAARNQYASAGQVQDNGLHWGGTAGGTANALTLSPSMAIPAYVAGQVFWFIAGAAANTSTATVAISGLPTIAIQNQGAALAGGEIAANKYHAILYDGTAFQLFRVAITPAGPFVDSSVIVEGSGDATKKMRIEVDTNVPTATTIVLTTPNASGTLATGADAQGLFLPRSYLAGLQLTYSSGTTLAVAAGQCRDSTNVANITVSALTACAITASTAWTAGSSQNKLNNQALPAAGTLHVFAMRKDSDGTGDIIIDASLTPSLPSGYTYYRRIASLRTSSSAWRAWVQDGDSFMYLTPVGDVVAGNMANTRTLRTLTVPVGIRIQAIIGVTQYSDATVNPAGVWIGDPSVTDASVAAITPNPVLTFRTANEGQSIYMRCYTNTSAQVADRGFTALASNTWYNTFGWIDTRGRDD